MIFIVVLLISASINAFLSFNAVSGHTKAKTYIVLTVFPALFFYGNGIAFLVKALMFYDDFLKAYLTPLGDFPDWFNLTQVLFHFAASITMIILCMMLIRRIGNARKLFLKIIPVVALIEAFGIYRIFIENNTAGNDPSLILITSLMISGLVHALIYLTYDGEVLKKFFAEKK